MKKLLSVLFGKIGLLICGVLMSVVSWFLFPIFIQILKGGHSLSSIIGWLFVCPFAVGFYLSAISSSLTLFAKGIKDKQWWWIVLSIVVVLFDISILIVNLV